MRSRCDPDKGFTVASLTVAMYKTLAGLVSDSLEDHRDLALIGLGIVRALRGPSELLGLDLTTIRSPGALGAILIKPDGATVTLTKTKSNQHDGERLDIEDGPALDAVRAWIAVARIRPGTPLWRTFRNGCVMHYSPTKRTLRNIVQRRAAQVLEANGTNHADAHAKAREFSTHLLRHGALTSLGQDGASLTEIMSLSRHSASSARIAMGYCSVKAACLRRQLRRCFSQHQDRRPEHANHQA